MSVPPRCPLCDDLLIEVEVGLNRTFADVLAFGMGSSQLEIRMADKDWMPFMEQSRSAHGLYCTACGALTVAPSIPAHREQLGLPP